MDPDEAEQACDELAELASTGPAKNPGALVQARAILRRINQSAGLTPHVREQATQVDRALSGWFDAEEQHWPLLRTYRGDIDALIERLQSALREAARFKPR